jgi:hypothetical protein
VATLWLAFAPPTNPILAVTTGPNHDPWSAICSHVSGSQANCPSVGQASEGIDPLACGLVHLPRPSSNERLRIQALPYGSSLEGPISRGTHQVSSDGCAKGGSSRFGIEGDNPDRRYDRQRRMLSGPLHGWFCWKPVRALRAPDGRCGSRAAVHLPTRYLLTRAPLRSVSSGLGYLRPNSFLRRVPQSLGPRVVLSRQLDAETGRL